MEGFGDDRHWVSFGWQRSLENRGGRSICIGSGQPDFPDAYAHLLPGLF
jgi:hypothetical protein